MKKLMIVALSLLLALTALGCTVPAPAAPAAEPAAAQEAAVIPQETMAETVPAETGAEAAVPVAEPAAETAPEAAPAAEPAPAAAAAENDIGMEAAKQIAFAHAKLSEAEVAMVAYMRSNLDREDGRLVYEIDFVHNGVEYEYEIDPATGSILSFDNDIADFDADDYNAIQDAAPAAGQSGVVIGEDKARAIVIGRVPGASAADVRLHLETDDGRQVYEGELIHDGWEYEFELDAATGDIREWDTEPWPDND